MNMSDKAKAKVGRPRKYAEGHRAADKARRKRAARAEKIDVDLPDWTGPSSRRESCRLSLLGFINTYLPHRFSLAMSPDHHSAIERMQSAVLTGGQYAQAAPRGDGKTERTIACLLWAVLYAHRRFVPVVAADLASAKSIVREVFAELADNEELEADWPHICVIFREVLARPNRARFITHAGEPVRMDATANRLVLPSPAESADPACGGVIVARGITSSIRGLRHKPPRGGSIRPDLLIIDDPQTDESAHSPEQCKTRENLISGTLLGLAGPNKKIAAIANMTIIRPGDLAHRLLDPGAHPEWNGVRYAMVYDWPTAKDKLWKQYAEMRRDGQRSGDGGAAANAFYESHRDEMDAGARVGWEHRRRDGEATALQCAFNLLIDLGEQTFYAEYQNDPKVAVAMGWEISEQRVCEQLSGVARGTVPSDCEILAVGCDVNLYGLNWVLTAWTISGVGYIVDYGKYPPVDRPIWDSKSTMSEEQAIFQAIQALGAEISARPYARDNERAIINVFAVDCGYKREAVVRGCAHLGRSIAPTLARPIRALSTKGYRPLSMNRRGDGWHTGTLGTGMALFINADVWRERAQKAFLLPVGSPGGSVALYGSDPHAHLAIADHICAERVVDVLTGEKSGIVYSWAVMPGRRNDLLDALCYSMAAACYSNVQFAPTQANSQTTKAAPQPEAAIPVAAPSYRRRPMPPRQRGGFVNAWR